MDVSTDTERQFNYHLNSKDENAFSFLFDNYGATINGIVRGIFPEPAISDSVFKNTFLNICNNIHEYDQHKSPLSAWLILQTRNYLKEIVSGLSDISKRAISNKNIIDLSYAYTKQQIATVLDVPIKIVDTLIQSAISKIRYDETDKKVRKIQHAEGV